MQEENMIRDSIVVVTSLMTKNKFLAWLLVPFVAMFAPIAPLIHVMIVLLFIDMITGIAASMKRDNVKLGLIGSGLWSHIKSRKIGLTLSKAMAYILLIISAFIIDKYIIGMDGSIYLTKVLTAAAAFRELFSILENSETITGRSISGIIVNIIRKGFKEGLADTLDNKKQSPK